MSLPQTSTISSATHQIRALYDSTSITVYQAYSSAIATPAVTEQRLNASPAFKMTRMTWIKPSWCWMMYRSGYSLKQAAQERILAIQMTHEGFLTLLSQACLTSQVVETGGDSKKVRVQWDPERSARLDKLGFRSIQIGIPGDICERWIEEWIVGIQDVTEKARKMKETLDAETGVSDEELIRRGLMPEERLYELPAEIGVGF